MAAYKDEQRGTWYIRCPVFATCPAFTGFPVMVDHPEAGRDELYLSTDKLLPLPVRIKVQEMLWAELVGSRWTDGGLWHSDCRRFATEGKQTIFSIERAKRESGAN